MEHLSGSDLAALIDARVRIPYAEAVDLVLQACEAIAEAHSLGIIHRDLKPSNIFVTHRADGAALVKVLDFGISKFQNPLAFAGDEATLTASGSDFGSPAYMSPEQIRSAKGTDARSDVWAIGVILYELVSGQNPFIGETIGDIMLVKIATGAGPPDPFAHARRSARLGGGDRAVFGAQPGDADCLHRRPRPCARAFRGGGRVRLRRAHRACIGEHAALLGDPVRSRSARDRRDPAAARPNSASDRRRVAPSAPRAATPEGGLAGRARGVRGGCVGRVGREASARATLRFCAA